MQLTIGRKLILACVAFALVPMLVIGFMTWRSANQLAYGAAEEFRSTAQNIADKIDRNLFERYGDVQAFGVNEVVRNKDHWYKSGDDSPIVQAMNKYVELYGIYYLTILVDLDGKVIAVNDRNAKREPIKTKSIYEQNFAKANWFNDAKTGKFYTTKDSTITGTVVEDFYVDDFVREVYHDEGLAIGFTAPVFNEKGETIAVWKNVAQFGVVEEIIYSYYNDLKSRGLPGAEITLLDKKGNVLVDCDPSTKGTEKIQRDLSVIGKLNLVDRNLEAAVKVCKGEAGVLLSVPHVRKKIDQVAGFTPLRGALGFAGMPWSVLVRVTPSEALAAQNGLKTTWLLTMLVGAVVIPACSWYLAKTITTPIRNTVDVLRDIAQGEGDLTKRLKADSKDEMAELCNWFNVFVARIENIIGQIANNAHTLSRASHDLSSTANELSNGAVESKTQSATISSAAEEMAINMKNMASSSEQMSGGMRMVASSVEEMTSTIAEIAKNAETSASVAAQAATLAEVSNDKISRLGNAAQEIGKVIEVIQDIAEQTNLLALNATIEAARAGEAGKGFAVVATEVKELAKQTATATDDIRARIEAIQLSTNEAVSAIQSIGGIIRNVNEVSRTIAAAVEEQSITTKEIARSISEVASASDMVARGVGESATASQEITQSMGRVDNVLNQTAAAAEESRSAGDQLSGVASEMQKLVGRFTISDDARKSVSSLAC